MSFIPVSLSQYLPYAAPPLLGAFIGYLTNKVAIKMLFRPLKAWYFLGVKIPMTPGVIPSKRHDLAVNMGEMVGSHLLTSTEITGALERESFQGHLYTVIENRVGGILQKDLGPLPELIPEKFSSYFEAAEKAVINQVQQQIHNYLDDPLFAKRLAEITDRQIETFLDRELADVLPGQEREIAYGFLEDGLGRMLTSPAMEDWVDGFVRQKVYGALQQEKSCADLMPAAMQELLIETILQQTPQVLEKLGTLVNDPLIREKIIKGVCQGVESFIETLGPMAGMVKNFLSMDTVAEKVGEYLVEKEEDIVKGLASKDIQDKAADLLRGRVEQFLSTPLVSMIKDENNENVESFCSHLAQQITALLREPETAATFASMIKDNIETHIFGGKIRVEQALIDLFGQESVGKGKNWLQTELLQALRSPATRRILNGLVENMAASLLAKNIGKPADFLPAGVRDGIYQSIRKMASSMLAVEIPGVVESLNIRQIVSDKVDSLDLMRLERLLMSIMEEQFKYINLFGAFLGFLIGCANLLFLVF